MSDSDVVNFWLYLLSKLGSFLSDHGLFGISFVNLFAVSSVFLTVIAAILSFNVSRLNISRPGPASSGKEKVNL